MGPTHQEGVRNGRRGNFRERLWLPLTVLTLEVLLVVVGFKMHALDRELSSAPRRKKREIALPRD